MKKLFATLVAVLFSSMTFAAVNINTATEKELESLNGIGPVKAKAIVDYRKKNGNFKTLEDIKKVDGVGDVTFDNIKKDISLSGKTEVAKTDDKKAEPAKKEEKPQEAKDRDESCLPTGGG